MAVFLRHFAHPHPLFREKKSPFGVEWQKSVYYLWWEYLRRHEGYKRTCEKGGGGKYADLYKDFGDVHALDFRAWWSHERGARLFAEPSVPTSVMALGKNDLDQVRQHWDEAAILVVAIPLTLPKRFIERSVRKVVAAHHTRKRGVRQNKESRALYPITHQFSFRSLQFALEIYDYREAHPDVTLWEIAQELKFTRYLKPDELKRDERGKQSATTIDKKNTMSVGVSRKLKQAEAIIENVGKGLFPGPI